jgi:hypothetical protein
LTKRVQQWEAAASSGGEQINDFLDGFVGAVIVSMSLLSDNPVCALFEPWVVREKRSKSSM